MEKIWLKEYPDWVPAEIDINTYATSFVEILEKSAAQHGHLVAFECMGTKLSFAQLDILTINFASYLTGTLGLVKGDRVAIMLPNLLQYPVAMFGIMRAGLVVVNINPLYTSRELDYQLRDSGARAIVLLDGLCAAHQSLLARAELKAAITTSTTDASFLPENLNDTAPAAAESINAANGLNVIELRTALATGGKHPFTRIALTRDDNAFLQYTGGTTGISKGAQLTQGNITANVLQMRLWMFDPDKGTEECFITMLPLYHIMALTVSCLLSVSLGGKNVLFPNPRDIDGSIAELKKHRFTLMLGVNTLFNSLLNTPSFAEVDFSALKLTIGGGAAVQQAVAERWKKLTGNDLSEAYGLSETSPGVTFAPIDKPQWNGTIGVPLPSTIVSLRDDDNREVLVGSPGELCIKGPQVMRGYWNKPKETEDAFTPDGYFKTGDIGIMNDRGYIKLVDRKKDVVLVSGFNVYPTEIEAVVALHEGVLECACVGVPDEKSGEVPKVYIVRKDPGLDINSIEGHCRKHLAGYKLPKHFEFRDALPKSNVGKILRRELRKS
jgi:long-chain acyl-CoA synthetase